MSLFIENLRKGINSGHPYEYTCPSPGFYPYQWLWDSSLHGIAFRHAAPDRAKQETETLLSKQKENGFISCVTIWNKKHFFDELLYMTTITQPPVIPITIEKIYETTHDTDFVRRTYPRAKKFLNWLSRNRDEDGDGLVRIIHPWEDGDDGNPSFDEQMGFGERPNSLAYFYSLFKLVSKYRLLGWDEEKISTQKLFSAKTALFNSIYARSLFSMSGLSKILGNGDSDYFDSQYKLTRDAIIRSMWSEKDKIFYNLDQNGKQVAVKTISSLMPLILPDLPGYYSSNLVSHLTNKDEFWTPYPVPSVATNEPTFNPGRGFALWRGPSWVNTNWFLVEGLMQKGYTSTAKTITERTREMVKKSGFREFYNPLTAEGHGAKNFTWSTLVFDMSHSLRSL